MLLTNVVGDWVFVSQDELGALARGQLAEGTPLYERLASKNFIRSRVDPDALGETAPQEEALPRLRAEPARHGGDAALQRDLRLLPREPRRHGRGAHGHDPGDGREGGRPRARRRPRPRVTIEFQGGEPLVNFAVVKHIIEYALEKNRAYGKQLEFTMVSNLSLMDEEKLAYLVDNKVQICTSIDGPEPLHTKQRVLPMAQLARRPRSSGSSASTRRTSTLGLDPTLYHVEALLTTTREALKYPRGDRRHVRRARLPRASSSGPSIPSASRSKTARVRRVRPRRVPRLLPERPPTTSST